MRHDQSVSISKYILVNLASNGLVKGKQPEREGNLVAHLGAGFLFENLCKAEVVIESFSV